MQKPSFSYLLFCSLALAALAGGAALAAGQGESVWQIQTVATGLGTYGGFSSLKLDAAGHPHIAYRDGNAGALKYAYHDGTTWQISTVDSAEVWGVSLALDTSDRPHICYRGYGALRYAYYDGAGWQLQTVESGGDTGWDCSLALDAAGRPAIAYFHHDPDDLKYARYDGTAWQIQTLDAGGDVGRWASLALDVAGHPHIGYLDYTLNNLKYAYYDGTSWHVTTVDSAGDVGFDVSLVLDPADHPHISYRDNTNQDLKYAYHNGSTWVFSVVDGAGDTGHFSSLGLDGVGQPHISYFDWTSTSLKYAWYDGATWQIERVDGSQPGSYMTSLALDATGRPHISYSDSTAGALKYAVGNTLPPPTPVPTPTPCYWDSFPFGVDSWLTAAPPESTVATFAYQGHTYPALAAVQYGAGRSVLAPGTLFTQMYNIVSPGNVRHSIFLNSVAWVTSATPPTQTHVLVTWGHRELVTYHQNYQCCSSNAVVALTDAGYIVDTAFDVPSSLDGYDAVVMPGVGWIADPGYPNPQWWSGSSGHALTSAEIDTLVAFVHNGGGLVASVEWDLGAAWMNPVGNPMGVTFAALSSASPLVGTRVLDHPVMGRTCPEPTPLPTDAPTPPPLPTSTPVPPTSTPVPPPPTPLPTSTPVPPPPTSTPPPACALYPIALHIDTVRNAVPGQEIRDILNGSGPGNFGWLTWTGNQGVPTLVYSLTPPGDSYTYINPDNPQDHTVSIGDWVRGRPGVANSRDVRQALENLKPLIITVPVWGQAQQTQSCPLGYQIVGFARIQITDYHLPQRNRISAIFWGFANCGPDTTSEVK